VTLVTWIPSPRLRMTTSRARAVLLASLLALVARPALADGSAALGGSLSSMTRQHGVALKEARVFVGSAREVAELLATGELVALAGNADYAVSAQVQHRYARPEVRRFVERLAGQYHAATGERLVVTSLVRPEDEQPANAHRLSVHPAGMAVDLRVSQQAASRAWLERILLGLEREGVLDVTREQRPPHYHVAVFPAAYAAYADARESAEASRAAAESATRAARAAQVAALSAPTAVVAAPAAAFASSPAPAGDAGRSGLLALLVAIGGSAVAATVASVRRSGARRGILAAE
jgi:hypothetical protein